MIISCSVSRSLVVLELVLPLNHAKTTKTAKTTMSYYHQFCIKISGLIDAEVAKYLLFAQNIKSCCLPPPLK